MPITVGNVVQSKEFINCKVISGIEGLYNLIYRVTVIESPVLENQGCDYGKPGDFNITSLYAYKDNPQEIKELVKILINEKSAALCYADTYINDLPQEVKDISNENKFPIIKISTEVSYGLIISSIMEDIIKSQNHTLTEIKLKQLLDSSMTKETIRNFAYQMNKSFEECALVMMLNQDNIDKISAIDLWKNKLNKAQHIVCNYKDNLMVILTYNKRYQDIEDIYNLVLTKISEYEGNFNIGISKIHMSIDELPKAIQESIESLEIAKRFNRKYIEFTSIAIYRLLISISETPQSMDFVDSILDNIKNEDKENNSKLLDTAKVYYHLDCNLKKVARKIGVHENTIRYRLNRIKDMIDYGQTNNEFNQTLYLALMLDDIINKSTL